MSEQLEGDIHSGGVDAYLSWASQGPVGSGDVPSLERAARKGHLPGVGPQVSRSFGEHDLLAVRTGAEEHEGRPSGDAPLGGARRSGSSRDDPARARRPPVPSTPGEEQARGGQPTRSTSSDRGPGGGSGQFRAGANPIGEQCAGPDRVGLPHPVGGTRSRHRAGAAGRPLGVTGASPVEDQDARPESSPCAAAGRRPLPRP